VNVLFEFITIVVYVQVVKFFQSRVDMLSLTIMIHNLRILFSLRHVSL
jgi:hypothetical protein